MKKSILIIGLCVAMLLVGCQKNVDVPNNEQEQSDRPMLNEYYTVEDNIDDIAASFYLGYGEDGLKEGKIRLGEKYFSKMQDKWPKEVVEVSDDMGDEYYLILPKYENTIITIHSVKMNDKSELVPDKELISTKYPVLLRCNISDIMPSTQVTITHGEETVIFSPSISLKDGQQNTAEGIFTE